MWLARLQNQPVYEDYARNVVIAEVLEVPHRYFTRSGCRRATCVRHQRVFDGAPECERVGDEPDLKRQRRTQRESTRRSVASWSPPYRDPGLRVVTQVAIVCRDIEATSWAAVRGVDPPQTRTTKPAMKLR